MVTYPSYIKCAGLYRKSLKTKSSFQSSVRLNNSQSSSGVTGVLYLFRESSRSIKFLKSQSCPFLIQSPPMAGPQSKLCSQGLDPEWITIPLEKFSFAISPLEARTHQWVHDSRRDDLFLVFRPERLPRGNGGFEKTTLMIVLAGADILVRKTGNRDCHYKV